VLRRLIGGDRAEALDDALVELERLHYPVDGVESLNLGLGRLLKRLPDALALHDAEAD
jgi:hypothetical protein